MAATITIDNLDNGQEVILDYTVTGTAAAQSPATDVVIIAWQIDDQELIDTNATPAPSVPFSLNITPGQCTAVDTYYMLTIYVWDDQGDLAIESRTFKRIE
jgi:hypothetical protein